MTRQSRQTLYAAGLITALLTSGAFGQQQEEKLGTLSFPTSCDPKVQAEFERGVAMIHSYWFLIARRTFENVLRQDPTCAIAYWGIALDLLNNSLAVVPPRADAEAAPRQRQCPTLLRVHADATRHRRRARERWFRSRGRLPPPRPTRQAELGAGSARGISTLRGRPPGPRAGESAPGVGKGLRANRIRRSGHA